MKSTSGKDVPDYCQVLRFKDSSGQTKEMIFPKGLDLDRPKRPRTTFTEEQLGVLETEFAQNQYLIGKERNRLAKKLGLSETQIKVWFQNRRTKCKREKTPNEKLDGRSPSSPTTDIAVSPSVDDEMSSDSEELVIAKPNKETTTPPPTPSNDKPIFVPPTSGAEFLPQLPFFCNPQARFLLDGNAPAGPFITSPAFQNYWYPMPGMPPRPPAMSLLSFMPKQAP